MHSSEQLAAALNMRCKEFIMTLIMFDIFCIFDKDRLMNLFAIALTSVLAFSFTPSISEARPAKEIRSIHELPKIWNGEAGNLVVRVPTQLTIHKVLSVLERVEKGSDLRVRYAVEGEFIFGERTVQVTEAEFSNNSFQMDDAGILILKLNDTMSPRWAGLFSYDEASQTYRIREFYSQNHPERVRLTGQK